MNPSRDFYEDTDDFTRRDIGPFNLAADLQELGDSPGLVFLSTLDVQYLLALVEFLKEKEVWQPNHDWETIVNYVEDLELRLKSPVSWTDLLLPLLGGTVSYSLYLPILPGYFRFSLGLEGLNVEYIKD